MIAEHVFSASHLQIHACKYIPTPPPMWAALDKVD